MKEEETKRINAVLILEVIGRPPEHLTKTLSSLIEQMSKEKGVSVIDKKINEPVLMKEKIGIIDDKQKKEQAYENFYTTFAEVEINVEEIFNLAFLMFKYMPAHIEIVSPELIALTNNSWGDILNEFARRLHGYDEIARIIQVEKAILEKQLRELMPKKEEKTEKDKKIEIKKDKGKFPEKKASEKK